MVMGTRLFCTVLEGETHSCPNNYCCMHYYISNGEPNSSRRTRDLIKMYLYVRDWYPVVIYGTRRCNQISGRRCLVLCIHIIYVEIPVCFCSAGDKAPMVCRRSLAWCKSLPPEDRINTLSVVQEDRRAANTVVSSGFSDREQQRQMRRRRKTAENETLCPTSTRRCVRSARRGRFGRCKRKRKCLWRVADSQCWYEPSLDPCTYGDQTNYGYVRAVCNR